MFVHTYQWLGIINNICPYKTAKEATVDRLEDLIILVLHVHILIM